MSAFETFMKCFWEPALKIKLLTAIFITGALFFRGKWPTLKALKPLSRPVLLRLLFSILFLAFILRFAWIVWSPHTHPSGIAEDGRILIHAADLAAGKGFIGLENGQPTAIRPFGYPLFLSLIFRLFGQNMWMVEGLQIFLQLLAVLSLFFLAREIGGDLLGLLSASILAFHPSSIFSSKIVVDEHLFLPFWLAGMALVISDFKKEDWRKILCAGILFGIGADIRSHSGMMGFVVFAFWLLAKRNFRAAFLRLVFMQAIILLSALPWAVRNYYKLGSPVLYSTTFGSALYQGNNPHNHQGALPPEIHGAETEVERSRAGAKAGLEWIRRNPGAFIQKSAGRVLYLLGLDREEWPVYDNFYNIRPGRTAPSLETQSRLIQIENYYYGSFFMLALCGLGLSFFHFRRDPAMGFIILTLIYYLSLIALTLSTRKYRHLIDPLLALLSAYFISHLLFAEKPAGKLQYAA